MYMYKTYFSKPTSTNTSKCIWTMNNSMNFKVKFEYTTQK